MVSFFSISDADNCQQNSCENGGTCYNDGDLRKCICTPGYEGTTCTEGKLIRYTSPLVSNICTDGMFSWEARFLEYNNKCQVY